MLIRALASHHFGAGLIPGVDAICGMSLLLVLVLAPKGFSPGTRQVLSSPKKTNSFKFEFDLERTETFKRVFT